jgi:hypothetical protein
MPIYEDAIKKPISNALFGSLFRLILIQVQKQKVDLEKGMLALDQLLKSNELNFQMLAAIPAVLLFLGGYFALYLTFTRESQVILFTDLRQRLLAIEGLLNRKNTLPLTPPSSPSPSTPATPVSASSSFFSPVASTSATPVGAHGLGYKNYGRLLLLINQLNETVKQLPKEDWKAFSSDLLELASEKMGIHQRLGTVNRIYHSPYFLKLQR